MIELGSTFRFRVAKGRIGICRVVGEERELGRTTLHPPSRDRWICVLVMRWEGAEKTTLARMKASATFRQPLALDHHSWPGHWLGHWVRDSAPKPFELVGVVPLTAKERALAVWPVWSKKKRTRQIISLGDWSIFLDEARRQWKWDHQREKVVAADRRKERREERQAARFEKTRKAIAKKGPSALSRRRWFSDFKPAKMREACRGLVRDVLRDITGAKRDPTRDAAMLAKCVRAFNAIDGRFGRRFDTIDAEQIMEALGDIANACGIEDAMFERVVDGERDF